MRYLIISKEDCPRCEAAKQKLKPHDELLASVYRTPLEGWRENLIVHIDFLAQLSMQNDELPAVYDKELKRYLSLDELNEILGECVGGVCRL